MTPLPAGLNDAGQQREGARALGVAGTIANPPSDHPMAQSTLCGIVGQRQLGMITSATQKVSQSLSSSRESARVFWCLASTSGKDRPIYYGLEICFKIVDLGR